MNYHLAHLAQPTIGVDATKHAIWLHQPWALIAATRGYHFSSVNKGKQ